VKCNSQHYGKYYDNGKISEKKQGQNGCIMVQKDQRIAIECVYIKTKMKIVHVDFSLLSIICISMVNISKNF